jgi:hypothetical protein
MAAEQGLSGYQGAWLTDSSRCTEVFSSTGKGASFKKPVDIFAPAFIISGNRLRTPMASCGIRSVKPTGDRQTLVLNCTNAVAGHQVSVLMKSEGDAIIRYFNAQDTTGSRYQRCSP